MITTDTVQASQYLQVSERPITSSAEAGIAVTDTTLAVYGSASYTPVLTLPSGASMAGTPAGGARFRVRDAAGNAATYNITINAPGSSVNGAASFVLSVNRGTAVIEWNGTAWQVWSSTQATGGSSTSPTPRTWYVNGGASAGGNGSEGAPFQTIAPALAACAAGDWVLIAPGTYAENLTWPNVDNITLRGAGKNATIINGGTGSPTLSWAPVGGSYTKMAIRDLTLRNANNGQLAIKLDGDGTAILSGGDQVAQFLTVACDLDQVLIDSGGSTGDKFYFRTVDKLYINDGNGSTIAGNAAGWNGSGQFLNVGYVWLSSTTVGNGTTGFTYTYDYTLTAPVKPAGGRQGFFLLNGTSVYGSVTLTKAPQLGASGDVAIYGPVIATSLQNFTAPMRAAIVRLACTIGSPAAAGGFSFAAPAITAPMAAGGAIPYLDLTNATLWLSATAPFNVSGAAGAIRFSPVAQLCRMAVAAGGTAAGSVVVGAETDLDMVGSKYQLQSMLTATGNGAIRRDYHDMGDLTSPGAQTFTPPFPTGSTLFVATEVSTNVAIGVSAKTVSGFTLSGASAAGGVRARVNLVV